MKNILEQRKLRLRSFYIAIVYLLCKLIYPWNYSHSNFYTNYSGYKGQLAKAFTDICQLLQFRYTGNVVGDVVIIITCLNYTLENID